MDEVNAKKGILILGKIEELLLEYDNVDTGFYIKLSNILDVLEFQCMYTPSREKGSKERLCDFFEKLNENIDRFSLGFLAFSLMNFIDGYFDCQIKYHGMYCVAACEVIENPNQYDYKHFGFFNSATPQQTLSRDYYANILNCKNVWDNIASSLKAQLLNAVFSTSILT